MMQMKQKAGCIKLKSMSVGVWAECEKESWFWVVTNCFFERLWKPSVLKHIYNWWRRIFEVVESIQENEIDHYVKKIHFHNLKQKSQISPYFGTYYTKPKLVSVKNYFFLNSKILHY